MDWRGRLPVSVCLLLVVGGAPSEEPEVLLGGAPPLEDTEGAQPDYYDEAQLNISAPGQYLGSPCQAACNPALRHVVCDPATATCACDAAHPVQLGAGKGCGKPKKLGEQCFYRQTCQAFDVHASCVQVNHNAFCQCLPGYHSTSHSRPTHRVFCTEDLVLLTADLPTLLGVASGIFVLAGLLCMVLHLYTRARLHPDHLADARLTPPCLYSLNDTGGTLSATRPSSRSSTRSATTGGTLDSGCSRRVSRARGVPVSASRAGAARAAAILLISRHLKAVRRDGGAHESKCAAKAIHNQYYNSLKNARTHPPPKVQIQDPRLLLRFATSKSNFATEQHVFSPELQRASLGAREGAEGAAADEPPSRSVARQDGWRAGAPETGTDAFAPVTQQLQRPASAGPLGDQRVGVEAGAEAAGRGRALHQLFTLLTAGPRQGPSPVPGLPILGGLARHRLDVAP